MDKTKAEMIVNDTLWFFYNRKGFDDWFGMLDADIQIDIRDNLIKIVDDILNDKRNNDYWCIDFENDLVEEGE